MKPSRPGLPPLNALRAFESAARLQSFVNAANELCVTPAAVAQQIKILEEWADIKLFIRQPRGVRLTSAGETIRDEFVPVFDQLGLAVQKLRSISSPNQVYIAALPSIAQYWMSPILPRVRQQFPDISISVNAVESPPNMDRESIDICLFFDDDPEENQNRHIIAQDIIYPVCAPSLLDAMQRRSSQESVILFHDNHWLSDWSTWLSNSTEMIRTDTRGPVLSLYSLALEEVKNGAGALIGHEALVSQYLDNGTLVKPFNKEVYLQRWLILQLSKSHHVNPVVREIADFLINLSRL